MTFNQPEKLNTLAGISHTELSTVFRDIDEDEGSDIVVVTGAGRVFSAGGDIEYMQYLRDNPQVWYKCVREARNIVNSMLECEKTVVAKINGDAIGLGATVSYTHLRAHETPVNLVCRLLLENLSKKYNSNSVSYTHLTLPTRIFV